MIVLGFDTSAAFCSAALWRDGAVLAARREAMARGHAEALLPMIGAALAEAALDYRALDRIAVTVGPGAFTGIRIGLAAARGISLAAGVPAFGVTTFAIHAAALDALPFADGPMLVALETKRADLYVQLFDDPGTPAGDPACVAPDALAAWCVRRPAAVTGDAASRAAAALAATGLSVAAIEGAAPDAAIVARLGAAATAAMSPRPLYLRGASVTLPGTHMRAEVS